MFRSLSASSPLGIFTTDLEGRWTYVNPRCRQLLDISLTESASEGWLQRIQSEDRARIAEQWSAFIRNSGEFLFECKIVKRGGALGRIQIRVAPIVSETGGTTGRVGTVEDITNANKPKRRWHGNGTDGHLMHNVPDSIYFKDEKSCFLRINRTLATRLGLDDPPERSGKRFGLLRHERANRPS